MEMNNSFQNGLLAFQEQKFSEAVVCFQNAVSDEPENVNYLYYLGSSLSGLGRKSEAVEVLSRALDVTDAAPIRYMRAELTMDERPDAAAEDFSRIIGQGSCENRYWTSLSYLGRGLLSLETGDIDAALTDFTAAEDLARSEGDASLIARIGTTLEKNGF